MHRFFCAFALTISTAIAQSPAPTSTAIDTAARTSPSPTATPVVFSPQTLGELKRIQQAALNSDYAYRQQDARNYFHCHHTAADTLDKIVPKELVENSAVVAVTAYVLANMEQPLFR